MGDEYDEEAEFREICATIRSLLKLLGKFMFTYNNIFYVFINKQLLFLLYRCESHYKTMLPILPFSQIVAALDVEMTSLSFDSLGLQIIFF